MDGRWHAPKCLIGSNGDSGIGVEDESEELFLYYINCSQLNYKIPTLPSNPEYIENFVESPLKLALLFEKGY